MKICLNCNNVVEDSAAFCDKCGARVTTQENKKKVKKTGLVFAAIAVVLIILLIIVSATKETSRQRGYYQSVVTTNNASVENDTQKKDVDDSQEGFILSNDNKKKGLGTPDVPLDPQAVYDKLTYTPEMFYGEYRIRGGREAENKYGETSPYFTWVRNGREAVFTELPYRIVTGEESLQYAVTWIDGYDWMKLYYMRKYGDNQYTMDTVDCAYTIEGNKLILKVLDFFEVDKENNKIAYAFTDEVWEYTFAFSGRNLTLSNGENSVTLTTGLDSSGIEDRISVDCYLSKGSKGIDGIDHIDFLCEPSNEYSRLYLVSPNKETSSNSIAVLQENGLFTFTHSFSGGAKTYQFVYFLGGRDGLVLTDGTNSYYYCDTYLKKSKGILRDYLTEDQTGTLDKMSESQMKAIIEKKDNLMDDLAEAFNNVGIKVTIDENNGELAMDSTVLFGGDSSTLTEVGKAFLDEFVKAYTSIVFSEKYNGFVRKTMVEGHIAPVSGSTYESGLPLSEERANKVKDYCASVEAGADASDFATNLEAVAYSNSKPVVDVNGNINMAASRRVSFRFIINLE